MLWSSGHSTTSCIYTTLSPLRDRYVTYVAVAAGAAITATLALYKAIVGHRGACSRLPGPPCLPLLGSVLELAKFDGELYLALLEWRRQYGETLRLKLFTCEVVALFNPEHIHQVMVRESWPKSFFHDAMLPILGEGLLLSDGATWQRRRRMMGPLFTPSRLRRTVVPHFWHFARQFAAHLRNLPDGSIVDINELLSRITLDIMCFVGFGFNLNSLEGGHQDAFKAFHKVLQVAGDHTKLLPLGPQVLRFLIRKDIAAIDAIIDSTIDAKLAEPAKVAGRCDRDILDLLLTAEEDGYRLDRQEIRDEIITFMLAGHETTALTLTWTLYELARHPECLSRLLAEVDATPAVGCTTSGDISADFDVRQYSYAKHVLNETLRMYPPVVGTARRVPASEPLTVQGFTLKAGSTVLIPIFSKHHEEEFFPDPYAFRPDRWASDEKPPATSYMPFTLGPRICIGQHFFELEAPIILATLLRSLTFEMPPATSGLKIPATTKTGTLRPKGPVELVLKHRVR